MKPHEEFLNNFIRWLDSIDNVFVDNIAMLLMPFILLSALVVFIHWDMTTP